jgi:putative inorganic carbon (HCO3(-)) transporter
MTPARLARRVAAAELPIILAIAPALLFPSPERLVVLAIVPVVWLCARVGGGGLVPRTPVNLSLYVLLAMVGVSLFATFDVRFSLDKVSGVVLGTLLFWAITRWLTTPGRLRVGAAIFVLAGACLAVIGLLGTSVTGKFPALGAVTARLPLIIRGVPGAEDGFNPNPVGGCLVLFVPLQIALFAIAVRDRGTFTDKHSGSGSWLVLIQAVLLLLTAGTVLAMQSRGAWLGLLVAAAAFLVWHSRRLRLPAMFAAVAIIVLAVVIDPARPLELVVGRSGTGVGTASGRIELWSRAIYGIRDFPFTGMGMNTFRQVMPVRYPTLLHEANQDVAHAHNNLLQEALDLGIPGLVAYLSIWMVAAVLLVAVYRSSDGRPYRAMAGGLGGGLIAHFVFGMTDAIPLGAKVGVLFWLTLALTVALHRVALESRHIGTTHELTGPDSTRDRSEQGCHPPAVTLPVLRF